MTRLNKVVAMLTMSLLVPSLALGRGEYDINKTREILSPLTNNPLPSSFDPRDAEVAAKLKELTEKLKLTEKEDTWLKKVRAAQVELDKAKASETIPDLLKRNIQDEKERKRKEFAALFPSLQQQPARLNAARLKSNEDSCPADFGSYATLSNTLSSNLVTQVQQNTQKFLKQSKKEKLATIEDFKALNKQFKQKLKDKRDKQLASQTEKRNFKDSVFKMKQGIEGLKELTEEIENETDKRLASLGDALFEKFMPELLEENKDQEEVQKIAIQIQARLEADRQTAYNQGIATATELSEACDKMLNEVKNGDAKTGTPPIATTVMDITNQMNPNDPQTAQAYNQTIAQVTNDLKCSSAEEAVEAGLGEPMRLKIAALSGVPDQVTLLQTVMTMVPDMVNTIGQSQGPVEEAIADCETVSQQKDAFVAMINQGQSAQGSQARARIGAQRATAGPNQLAGQPKANPTVH